MKFRLVIHIPSEAGLERGALAKLEGAIVRVLAPQHSVHGRDLGPSHLILTLDSDDPEATWETAKGIIPEPTLSMTYVFYTLIDGPKGRGTEQWLWPPLAGDIPPRRDWRLAASLADRRRRKRRGDGFGFDPGASAGWHSIVGADGGWAVRVPVFVSCPTSLNSDQHLRREVIVRLMEEMQLEPRALGRSDYPTDYPLREVAVIAQHCSGGVILGFTQFSATAGVWKPGTNSERPLDGKNPAPFPSAWNHLEAGILFGLRLPLLIFREKGISGACSTTAWPTYSCTTCRTRSRVQRNWKGFGRSSWSGEGASAITITDYEWLRFF
jgi:hypothetical protein